MVGLKSPSREWFHALVPTKHNRGMNDERIHRHDWENGRCKVCGLSEQAERERMAQASGPPSPIEALKRDLGERLDRIEKRIGSTEQGIMALVLLIVVMLFILLLRGG